MKGTIRRRLWVSEVVVAVGGWGGGGEVEDKYGKRVSVVTDGVGKQDKK